MTRDERIKAKAEELTKVAHQRGIRFVEALPTVERMLREFVYDELCKDDVDL